MTVTVELPTGADARIHGARAPFAAVLLNGGSAREVAGTWSATSELLARELASALPAIRFVEVRYRIKSWKVLSECMADAAAAVELAASEGAAACALVGFSMGGAVSIGIAGHPAVTGVLGLSPWIPDRFSLDGLRGKRLDVLHGGWDRALPGIPGVSPASSRAGFERARLLGIEGTYEVIRGGLHGCAVRSPWGSLVRLPRWRAWVSGVAAGLERLQASAESRRRAS
jgi:dienelactone hydrolase